MKKKVEKILKKLDVQIGMQKKFLEFEPPTYREYRKGYLDGLYLARNIVNGAPK